MYGPLNGSGCTLVTEGWLRTAGNEAYLGLGSQKVISESIKSTLDSLEPKFL